MEIVPIPVGKAFLDEMAAVAGGIDRHIAGLGGNRSLEHRLEGGIAVVIAAEGEVVDEEDEVQRIDTQAVKQRGNLDDLALFQLDQAQAAAKKLVDHRLDGR